MDALVAAGIAFVVQEYEPPARGDFGQAAVAALDLSPDEVFKTLLARVDGDELVVAVVPVSRQLSLKRLAAAAGAKRATMAEPAAAERSSGYVVGGISPLGQRRRLRTFVDASATGFDVIHVSGGRRGLELGLAPADLIAALSAAVAPLT